MFKYTYKFTYIYHHWLPLCVPQTNNRNFAIPLTEGDVLMQCMWVLNLHTTLENLCDKNLCKCHKMQCNKKLHYHHLHPLAHFNCLDLYYSYTRGLMPSLHFVSPKILEGLVVNDTLMRVHQTKKNESWCPSFPPWLSLVRSTYLDVVSSIFPPVNWKSTHKMKI